MDKTLQLINEYVTSHSSVINSVSDLFYHSQTAVVPARAEVEDRLLGLDGGDEAVVARVEGLEGGLVLGVVLHLLLETHSEYHISGFVEQHLALVQLGHCPQQVEGSDVPNLQNEE